MRIIRFFAAVVLCFFSGPAFAQMPPEWTSCKVDTDCRIVGGGCYVGAVNHAHITQGTQYANDINARIECLRYMDPLLFRAACQPANADSCGPEDSCEFVGFACTAIEGGG